MDTQETGVGFAHGAPAGAPLPTVEVPVLVRINRAAELAGVSRRTIYDWIKRGLIETRFNPVGAQLVVVSSLTHQTRPVGVGTKQPIRSRRGEAA